MRLCTLLKISLFSRPGRDLSSISVKQAISCFALTTDNDKTVTTGSWNGYINHFDLRAPKLGPLFTLGGHTGGITWLRYAVLANSDSWSLFSGARKDNKILEWDMRNYSSPVREFTRNVATNQRIYFDVCPYEERWLVSGDTSGFLRIWDLENNVEEKVRFYVYYNFLLYNYLCNYSYRYMEIAVMVLIFIHPYPYWRLLQDSITLWISLKMKLQHNL